MLWCLLVVSKLAILELFPKNTVVEASEYRFDAKLELDGGKDRFNHKMILELVGSMMRNHCFQLYYGFENFKFNPFLLFTSPKVVLSDKLFLLFAQYFILKTTDSSSKSYKYAWLANL